MHTCRSKLSRVGVAALVIAVLSVGSLFAGPQPEAVTDEVTLQYQTLFSGGEAFIMNDLVQRFNEEHDLITVEEVMVEWGEHYTRLMTSILADDPPDIAVMHLAILRDYAGQGVLTPITDLVPDDFDDQFLEPIIEGSYFEGELYAVPIDTHPFVLYYSTTVLEEAGLVDDDGNVLVPETWDELMDYGRQIRDETDHWGVAIPPGQSFGERMFISIYYQLGGELYNEAADRLELDIDLASETYEILMQIYDEGLHDAELTGAETDAMFLDDRVGFLFNGVWNMARYPDELDVGVTEMPLVAGDTRYTWADSHSLVFPATGDPARVQAAVTFAQWLSDHSVPWAEAGHLPVNVDALQSQEFRNMPMRQDYIGAGENAILAPQAEGWVAIRDEMGEIGELLQLGQYTPRQAAEALDAEIRARQ